MFTVNVVKGAFGCEVVGSRVHIRCLKKSCKGKPSRDLPFKNPDPSEFNDHRDNKAVRNALSAQAEALKKEKTKGRHEFAIVDGMLKAKDKEGEDKLPNIFQGQLVTPCAHNGRPSGVRRVICPYCLNSGVLLFNATRIGPESAANIRITEDMNTSGEEHASRRVRITYIMLRAIDYLASYKAFPSNAHVVCPGASTQMPNRKTEGYQDAHQVLREVTINGKYLYSAGPPAHRQAMAYCLSVTSHLPEVWNEVDGLIESEITIPMILLAQNCVNGSLRKKALQDSAFNSLLWYELCTEYQKAAATARRNTEGEKQDILTTYISVTRTLLFMEPDFVQDKIVALWNSCL
jgi:hypothetical protein